MASGTFYGKSEIDTLLSAKADASALTTVADSVPQTPSDIGAEPAGTAATQVAAVKATNTQALAGTDDAHYVTPLGTKSAIDARNYTAVTVDSVAQPTLDIASTPIGAADVGLGNVTNTSDANKPVSTAQQAALDLKTDKAYSIVTFTNLTFDATHVGKLLNCTNSSAATLSIPTNANAAIAVGSTVDVYVSGTGQLTIGWQAGVTLRSRSGAGKSNGQYAMLSLIKVATDEWVLVGDVTT